MPVTVAIVFLLITVGSVVFHFWSPWWWPEVASNWGGMDDTIILTFWMTGFVFVVICLFISYCVWKFAYKKDKRLLPYIYKKIYKENKNSLYIFLTYQNLV